MKKTIFIGLILLSGFGILTAQNIRKSDPILQKVAAQRGNPRADSLYSYLNFLYDYMPLSDLADYGGDFFLKQAEYAMKARETFPWGRKIPEDVFKHFVLVYRVNNENLDTARIFIFEQLKDRIKGMDMYSAALEVNHWCHEKVNYKASDGRTSSPLATMRTSWGRCGEESTFTVTALRAVGIPARQCYTPRWAHTDDNHAWVEVWIDGVWHHLGACEPEPELDIAWFDAPAKRAMMVHTTVFGKYDGKEQKNYECDLYSKINLLSNYTTTKRLEITVKDEKGNAVKDAQVAFGLYNYAEYYPLAKIYTDQNGKAELETGLGDLMIWVKKDGKTASALAKAETEKMTLTIARHDFKPRTELYKICPPVAKQVKTVSEEKAAKNAIRVAYEDSLREAYLKTFPRNSQTDFLLRQRKLWKEKLHLSKEDSLLAEKFLSNSWGNYEQIGRVIASGKKHSLELLSLLYEKDLRDVDADVLLAHLDAYESFPAMEESLKEYVLNPRIQLEKITPYRKVLQDYFSKEANAFRKDPQRIADWMNRNLTLNNADNYYGVQISPAGVLKVKQCDRLSREIFFVAVARSLGIAARYEWAEGRAQYKLSAKEPWQYPQFEKKATEPTGRLIVSSSKENKIKPEYYTHFTLQRLAGDEWRTLDFEYDPKFLSFPDTIDVPAGNYRLMSGNRDADGNIYVREDYFSVPEGKTTQATLTVEPLKQDLKSLGRLNMESRVMTLEKRDVKLKELAKDKGMVLAIADPYSEPVRHLMADMPLVKEEMESWGGAVAFVLTKVPERNVEELYPNLPKQSLFCSDAEKSLEKQVVECTKVDFANNYPLLLFVTKEGDIVFLSQGYRIGSGESLLKVIHQLDRKNNE